MPILIFMMTENKHKTDGAENLTKEREKLDRYDYRIPIHSN